MTSKTSTKRGARIGTRIRGQMAAAYDARGESAGDLVLHFSSKMGMDVVLSSKLAYYHFLLVERDPAVASVDYAPSERLVDLMGQGFADLVDAEIKTTQGEVIWRRLLYKEPDSAQLVGDLHEAIGNGPLSHVSRLEVLTFAQLTADGMWTRNSHRALSWIAAASTYPLSQHKVKVLAHLKKCRTASFQECLELGTDGDQALYGASVLQLALNGQVNSNLGQEPLSARTTFIAIREGR